MNDLTVWDSIKRIYKENFNIPDTIIEYYSTFEILKKCISGYSNLRISYGMKDDLKYIKEVLFYSLGFEGWEVDLDFSPIAVYNRCNNNYERYRQDILMISSITPDSAIEISYLLCRRYKEIEREINKYVV
jgi:hypothetical protein